MNLRTFLRFTVMCWLIPVAAWAFPGELLLMTHYAPGVGPLGSTVWHGFSDDGRYVVSETSAYDLVPGDTNTVADIYVRDQFTGTNECVSRSALGAFGNKASRYPAISNDGRWVVFSTQASNLVPGDTNGVYDIFLVDRLLHTIKLLSRTPTALGNSSSIRPFITRNGEFVAYYTLATNLGGTGSGYKLVIENLVDGTRTVLNTNNSISSWNTTFQTGDAKLDMTEDGRYVALCSSSSLAVTDPGSSRTVYRWDRSTGQFLNVSQTTDGTYATYACSEPSMSADGNFVLFSGPGSQSFNAYYLRDIGASTLKMVTHDASMPNVSAYGNMDSGAVSKDGNLVCFQTNSVNMSQTRSVLNSWTVLWRRAQDEFEYIEDVPGGSSPMLNTSATLMQVLSSTKLVDPSKVTTYTDPFQLNISSRVATRVLRASNVAAAGTGGSFDASSDGQRVVFTGNALLYGVSGGSQVPIEYDVPSQSYRSVLNGTAYASDYVKVSGDKSTIAFTTSFAMSGDGNAKTDVYCEKQPDNQVLVASTSSVGAFGNGDATVCDVSSDGRYVLFTSTATNLVSGDTNNKADLFRKDLQTGGLIRVSVASTGAQSTVAVTEGSLSSDGRYVVFKTTAALTGEVADHAELYLRDCEMQTTRLVSRLNDGTPAPGATGAFTISGDGRFVGWTEGSTISGGASTLNIASTQTNWTLRTSAYYAIGALSATCTEDGRQFTFCYQGDLTHSFTLDRLTGQLSRFDLTEAGVESGQSDSSMISANGKFLFYFSNGADILPTSAAIWSLYRRERTISPSNVSGTVTFEGYLGPRPRPDIQVQLRNAQGAEVSSFGPVSVSLDGSFQLTVPIEGEYYVVVDGPTLLKRRIPTPFNFGAVNVVLPPVHLANGDVNQSGEVDAADIDIIIAAFGDYEGSPTFPSNISADLDFSAEIDAADIDLCISSFGSADD